MESVKEILKKNGFTFKKAFGQNFITDENLLKSIVSLSGIGKDDTVLEIGAGAGTLTRELSNASKKVYAYEIDKNLAPVLEETLNGLNNVNVVFADVMKKPVSVIEDEIGEEYTVVANLPYYITTPIIMRFIEQAKHVKALVIMVQEEVALRLSAMPDTADYGSITVAINYRGNAKIVKKVPREMFTPMPNVDSAVVKIDIVNGKYNVKDYSVFRNMLRAGFGNRRKMFINNVMQSFSLKRSEAEELLSLCEVPLTARGETLSAETYVNLANAYMERNI